MIVRLGATGLALASVFGLAMPAIGGAAPRQAPAKARSAMLPARLLDCSVGRITNFETGREQDPAEYTFDGRHVFRIYLPAIPKRRGPPPEATDPAEPVHPETRIVADPDNVANQQSPNLFDRVVDVWPERVEMTAPATTTAVNMIIVDEIAPDQRSATIFMSHANDAITFDLQHLYYGRCRVAFGAPTA